ncbi:MAG: PEGA domain-containing protein [Rikenellaceae bacterium]|nr:PEGA domain-containing protein [Rikenellaceae bacterium]
MKKLFAILLSCFITTTALAQVEHSIIIDESTFRAVQTDALTGANVDPIGLDHSRQACARVKIKFDRMNRAQVEALEVKHVSNTDLTKQKVAPYFDNVLILEMTAKPNTRFYVVSPDFGESNEVTLNLEPNREYEMHAVLNQTYSIVVNSNVAGADVYLDDIFKGQTGDNMSCTVSDVIIGEHTLRVVYGAASSEQPIDVNKNSIFFRQTLDVVSAAPQHVVFEITPVDIDAMVEIDGAFLQVTKGSEGIVDKRLKPGTYQYTVTAPNYNSHTAQIIVRDKKVEVSVALTPAFGFLNINGVALDDAVVYVDNSRVESNNLTTVQLPKGEHNIRIVKPRHKPYQTRVNIADGQSVNITPVLVANFAPVTIKASDSDTQIWLNDVLVAKGVYTTELELGIYEVEARKALHSSTPQFFEVVAAEPMTVELKAPTPICGSVDVSSTPQKGEIFIDDVATGQQTPATIKNLLIGEHTITVKKSGYDVASQRVTIVKDQMQYVTIPLKSNVQRTPATTPAKPVKTPTAKPAAPAKPAKTPAAKPKVAKSPKPAPAKVKPHYEQGIDAGYSMHFVPYSTVNHIAVSYIGGVRANRTMFVGLGVGAEYNFDNIDNSKLPALSAGGFNVPIYIHARAYMGSRSRTFFALSAGGKLFGSDNFTHNGVEYKYHTNGAFGDLSFGVNLGKFYFSLGASAQMLPWEESYTDKQLDIKSDMCLGAKLSLGFTF